MRIQLALNVRDLDEAIAFYAALFGAEVHKRRPGYANFSLQTPPLKLVLFENPDATQRLNHLGVEVFAPRQLEVAREHLVGVGLLEFASQGETCCHATQDKLWAREPQGLGWEWYRVTDDDPNEAFAAGGECCCAPPVSGGVAPWYEAGEAGEAGEGSTCEGTKK